MKDITYSFSVDNIYCILGHNGVGKTTLLNIIGGLLLPTSGEIKLHKKNVLKESNLRKDIFLISSESFFYKKLNAIENLKCISSLYGVNPDAKYIIKLCSHLDLTKEQTLQKIETYSSGMIQKLNFVLLKILKPKVILLDEPFNALDIKSQNILFNLLKEFHKRKHLIIFTTHFSNTVINLASKIVVLKNGEIHATKHINDVSNEKELEQWMLENY